MFWSRKEQAKDVAVKEVEPSSPVAVAEKEPPMPSSYAAKPELTVNEMDEYRKVATAIGLENSEALFNEEIRQCCAVNGLRIYSTSQVVKFLNFKLGKGKWEWLGLRDKDVMHLSGWFTEVDGQKINFGKTQYGQQVPFPVLLTVRRVLEDVPDAHFYISGVPGVDDDPFLLVTSQRASSFIIERWDEPDFREV